MKFLLLLLLSFPLTTMAAKPGPDEPSQAVSPLGLYSPLWNAPKFMACNTAAKANYMTGEEKKLIWILNMMRLDPKLFASTVIAKYPDIGGGSGYMRYSAFYKSLLDTMTNKVKPMNILYPDSLCFVGANCHAITAGKKGYVGHTRQNGDCSEKWYFNGECCDYGNTTALNILMNLMIDEGVMSLGHRQICLSGYKKIGVAIQPHISYGKNTVMDFHY